MSNPSDTSHPGRRVTLPPIRDLFRGKVPSFQLAYPKLISADEFMQSPPGEPPSSTLARLRVEDDGSETPHTVSSRSATSFVPSRTAYRVFGISLFLVLLLLILSTLQQTSRPESTSSPPSTPNRARVFSDASRYPTPYPTQPSPNPPFYPTHSFPQSDASLGQRPPNLPIYHSQSYPTSQSTPQPPHFPANVPSSQGPYPSQSHPNLKGLMSRESSRRPHVSTSSDLASSPPRHSLESPPALTRAAAPWVIATNLEVGQIYEDDERTPIARPFDGNSLARSTSHAIPLGRFLDDASGAPLGKYECKVCGKLFNRPSSLRVSVLQDRLEVPPI
jgi:hypothetical protein